VVAKVNGGLESSGLKKGDLDNDTQALITKLEKGEITETEKVREAEEQIVASAGKKEETSLEK